MVDSRFLIVTTLCYVGIFAVIFIVCCCAWTRYMRNEGRSSSRSKPKARANRRLNNSSTQPPEYPNVTTPMCAPPAQEFTEQTMYFPVQRPNNTMPRTHLYPMAAHYPMFDYQRANILYPTSVTTGTYDVDVNVDAAYGDTSQGGFSGEDFYSDATSSRFDGGDHEITPRVEVVGDKLEGLVTLTPRTLTPSPLVDSSDDKTQDDSDATNQA